MWRSLTPTGTQHAQPGYHVWHCRHRFLVSNTCPDLCHVIAKDSMRLIAINTQRAALKESASVLLLRWLEDPDAPDTVACKWKSLHLTCT